MENRTYPNFAMLFPQRPQAFARIRVNGYAFSAFLTDRFTVKEIVGRTVIMHSSPDDFTSQPSGNAGEKIACGEIVAQ